MFLRRAACLSLVLSSLNAATPAYEWVAAGGGAKNDKTRAVTFDRDGNAFLAGETTDDGTFGGLERKGHGGMDFFLAKVTPDGRFLWVRSLGGSLIDRGYGVATDAAGNAYVTGHFQSVDFELDGRMLPNAGDYDIFVAKYDTEGMLQWLRTAGGKGYDYGHAIAVDPQGDIVVSGAVAGEARFDGTVVNNEAAGGGRAIFCAKYDADGGLKWVRTTSGKLSGSGHGLGIDGAGNIHIGGSCSGAGAMGKVALESKTQAALVLKLSPEGEAIWGSLIPGVPSAGFHEICVDKAGRVWGAGMFKGVLNGGAQTTGGKDSDGFLAHFSPDGRLLWSHVIQSPGTDYCLGVTTDHTGRCFVTGEFSQTAAFTGQSLVSQGSTDVFTAAFDEKGGLEWLLPGGGIKGDNAYSMAWHPSGRLIISGSCGAPASFGTQTMTSPGGAEAYGASIRLK